MKGLTKKEKESPSYRAFLAQLQRKSYAARYLTLIKKSEVADATASAARNQLRRAEKDSLCEQWFLYGWAAACEAVRTGDLTVIPRWAPEFVEDPPVETKGRPS